MTFPTFTPPVCGLSDRQIIELRETMETAYTALADASRILQADTAIAATDLFIAVMDCREAVRKTDHAIGDHYDDNLPF